eukprot:CAMPEP_0196776888 /NCGR_PEP_ID=MMETSP1104-20130614/4900_1 /TAXON_ID=33652 /ORGANISM="Cafeteria sp., Strain Caron Lab Isolate" /LENGTH=347 /DNA_ID=CAMNT_0042147057 /DNA_START=54 /DNA_END=1097 /DNA_ORIENTATION=+
MTTEAGSIRSVVAADGKCVIQELAPAPLGARSVRIQVHGTAVNRADTLQRRGKYNPPPGTTPVLGLECSGRVLEVAPDCELGFKPGDRVMALLAGGGYAEQVVVDERLLMRVPDEMPLSTAGGLPEVWLTAYQLLHFVGRLREGDTVLIHAAGSGVGTAATQLAVAAGATVVGTAGREDKLEMAKSLGASAVFNYKTEDWVAGALEFTGGKGVTLVLDCVGASYWRQHVEVLAPDGRWVLYGLMGGADVDGPLLGALLRKRIRLEATTLRARPIEYKAELTRAMWSFAAPRFADGSFRVVADRSFALEEAQAAHEYVESNANVGKVLIRVREEEAADAGAQGGKEEL